MPWIFAAIAWWTAAMLQGPMVFSANAKPPMAPGSYAGTDACRPCHKGLVEGFLKNAHHLDSSLGTPESVLGDFTPGHNRLDTRDPNVFFTMESRPAGLFVVATSGAPPQQTTRAERIDIVTGSGRKGQTFLFWKHDDLFELPVSVWSAQKAWVNSPGYPSGLVNFDRPIGGRCLECHSTYFEARPSTMNTFNQTNFVLGIECEKCHGPGRSHIAARSKRPPAGPDVVNTGKVGRDLQVDLCATCHAGGIRPTSPAFSYIPGKPLTDYFEPLPGNVAPTAEVHGNQVALMKSSRCYQASGTMTCSTCHNVHVPQRDVAAFAPRCQSCHKVEACRLFPTAGQKIASRCVDCHMPNMRSGVIAVAGAASTMLAPDVRTHAIKIYREASNAVLRKLAQ